MMRFYRNSALEILLLTALITSAPAEAAASPAITRSQIEADWLRQDQVRFAGPLSTNAKVSPARDAIGAVDGVKNGKWGFHTENELNPWWQIDLRQTVRLDRLVIYNRCDFAERASRLAVLASDDAKSFREVYR
ncbi:MAG: discoidin domain-containing protein, partial [Planctomycetota bacterium]